MEDIKNQIKDLYDKGTQKNTNIFFGGFIMAYNYYKAVRLDIINAIRNYNFSNFETLEEFKEKLNDDLWNNDNVTGNASGSYTFSWWTAKQNVLDNLDLMHEAAEEFFNEKQMMEWLWNEEWESIDVTIRCYLLSDCIAETMEEIRKEFEQAHEENDNEEEE